MKKKKSGGGGANWMDTYGDMVTLLLCFFVLLYSMSTISEEKWRAIVTSFNPRAILTATDPEGNNGPIADPEDEPGGMPSVPETSAAEQRDIDEQIDLLYMVLKAYSEEEGMDNTLSVDKRGGKVYVTFNETTFFGGDSAVLRPAAKEVLDRVAKALDQVSDAVEEVQVQGHTAQARANEPNPLPGDWTLSTQRAANVVVYLIQNGTIHPARYTAVGHGQWWPISSNATAESRAHNRRVEMIISGRNLEQEAMGNSIQTYVTRDDEGISGQQ